MGEVYRARDTRLNRDVAIKVLPAAFAADADRLARFTREAQALAALNHPNIATIHGVEESDGTRALVMELVPGDDLAQLIARGPVPVAEALPIARQIAEALEAAHEHGIVHRDLKPANVKVRDDGMVKVLDFGLAKALDPVTAPSANSENSPTLSVRATQMGVVLGTASYMAPEQARGKQVDRRADIWAFGVVLYEMLTGCRLFDGDSIAETLGLIFSHEPDLAKLPPSTPLRVREVIGRCLVRDPRHRLRDIGEARQQIEEAIAGRPGSIASVPAPASMPVPVPATRRRPLGALLSVPLVAAAAAAGWYARPLPPAPTLKLSVVLPAGEQVTTYPAVSSDGRVIAYAAGRTPASSQLYLRALDEFEPRLVANSVGAQYPFFSPDGRSLGFFAGGRLRKVSVDGGAPSDVAVAPTPWGASWDRQNRIVYVSGLGSGLWQVSADGGTPEQLTRPDGADAGYAHVFPQHLPGSGDILFSFWSRTFYNALLPDGSRTWRQITPNARIITAGNYAASGYLLSNDGAGNVLAARWTPASTTTVTPDTPVIKGVYWLISTDRLWFNVSDTGTAVYVPGNPGNRRVVWVDRLGRATPLPGGSELVSQATLSRDGRRVVYGSTPAQWVVDLSTGARTRLVSEFRTWHGAWLPGDRRIALSSNRDGDWDLFTVDVDGGAFTPLLKRPFAQHVQAVVADGTIVFIERQPATGTDLWSLAPDGRAAPLVVTGFNEDSASVSSDGRYLAYVTDESGRREVFAMPMGGGPRVPVSIDGGTGPVWSRDGKELFYRAGDDLMSVQVSTTGPLVLGERKKLLDLSGYDSGYLHEFDVSPDGQRFLLIRTEPESRPARVDVVTNWFDELRGRVP